MTPENGAARPTEPPEMSEAVRARGTLMGLCYRFLGSRTDAEDAVQETYIRWYRLSEDERRAVSSPRAWLVRAASRIALDMLGTARARREHYVGEWLPEPVPTPTQWSSHHVAGLVDPADRVSLDDSVSMALLVVMESMTPAERVAFVLHDVFRYTFGEIADILGRTPAACRQLASSARRRVREGRRAPVPAPEHAAAVRSFKAAWETGELVALLEVLAPGATAVTDGGGLVSASLDVIHGAEDIARFLLGVLDRQPDLTLREDVVNGEPGLVAGDGHGRAVAVIAVAVTGSATIERVWAVRNPEKLATWTSAQPARRDAPTSAAGSAARFRRRRAGSP